MSSPKRSKTYFRTSKAVLLKKNNTIKVLKQRCLRLSKKVTSLKELMLHLKKRNLISEGAEQIILDSIPDPFQSVISEKLRQKNRHKKQLKYSEELRKFALTLQFYSTKAYNYVRKIWKNMLPHPSTIRNWYSVVGGKPGFTAEAFTAIKAIAAKKPTFCNIVIDEMKIKEELVYSGQQFYGVIDMGTELKAQNESAMKASYALTFMAVALNDRWKIPIGYFLIKSLTGKERANLLKKCLELMHETKSFVNSITFDGAACNIAMCSSLGANLEALTEDFRPWFMNPFSGEKVLIFMDACHMLKLVRNLFGDLRVLRCDNELIKWEFIIELVNLQVNEGLHAANKLGKKHLDFNNNRMSVKLAAQTLSLSTSKSLLFCESVGNENFKECRATSKFCETFNNAFDILNVRNKFSKKNEFNIPINSENRDNLMTKIEEIIKYIRNLRTEDGTLLLKSARKIGPLGFIVDLKNCIELYDMLSRKELDYLLTFKLSQDTLETFFSAIRSRGGFNNNPNAKQFETAYKRLLVKTEVSISNSNCLADCVEILQASSRRAKVLDSLGDGNELEINHVLFEHDYIKTLWSISPFVDDIVKYISGFISSNLIKNRLVTCQICMKHLIGSKSDDVSYLTIMKNRGPYLFPSSDVMHICAVVERIIRTTKQDLFKYSRIAPKMIAQTLRSINFQVAFNSTEMDKHIKTQDILDNHKINLVRLIADTYIKIRLHHECKLASEKEENIRQKFSRLILFKGQ